MPELTFLILNNPYLIFPGNMIGWFGWLGLLGLILYLLYRWRVYNQPWTRTRLLIFLVLMILVPITSVLLPGLELSVPQALPVPDLPLEPEWPVILVLSTLPWMLAGFLLGPSSAVGLAVFSGLLIAAWSNHNPFLPLELAFLACIYSALVNQRFRTRVFRLLRHPFVSALILSIIFPVFALISFVFLVPGTLENRLDYATTLLRSTVLAMTVNLLVGGLFAEVVYVFFPKLRESDKSLQPSPTERSLETRFLFTVGPISLLLVMILIITNWIVIDSTAKNMIYGRMANAARMTAESVPLVREIGANLIGRLAKDERLLSQDADLVGELLVENIRTIRYFRELFVLGSQGDLVAFFAPEGSEPRDFSQDELEGIDLALQGLLPIQYFATDPLEASSAAQLTFIVPLKEESGKIKGALVGRSDLANNPYAPSMLISLTSLEDMGGEGILIDEEGQILYHTDPSRVMDDYTGKTPSGPLFYDDTAYDGTRQLVYFQPEGGEGRKWAAIITVPAQIAQQQALNIIGPLLLLLAVLILIGFLLIKYGLRFVTVSLHTLTAEANRMSEGTLDQPLQIEGEDEAGQLGRAFEKMRANLKARLDELNQLLAISRKVASSLDIEDSLLPVLEAALGTGASSARVILEPLMLVDIDEVMHSSFSYGAGPASDLYHYLDDQILSLSKKRERILLNNLSRARIFTFTPGFPRPQAIMAVALQHENMFFGTFWIGYDQPHQFTDEEQRYLDTLAGLAALAVGNAYLFQSAEVGRQRLDAIVASTPDPVLVTDYQNHLLLANPAAVHAFGKVIEQGKGRLVDEVISDETLVNLMQSSREKLQSAELVLPNEHIYLATSSSVVLEEKLVGRVCVLRDVTEFKKLDALKSEFVSTVSHDLRSPLTLIRGYATMLQMVGELNEQQTSYGQKIIASVESMSRLVNNLLDLGRIEAGVGLQLEMVRVYDILEKVIGGLNLQAAQKHIQLDLEIPDQSIQLIEADPALLQQALHNLVENAIKFTEADGTVSINLHSMEDKIIFEVRDTGIGIAPADQQRLFEKFYRVTRRGVQHDRGTGLGLTIVKSIAERHGGRVWLESQLGRGSTFFLEIPVRPTG